ncbi:MAG: OmpP1/FadL family transporter [Gammaproteobacteria bacterium]|nr:OmpP1/FadL family transporter [Gammaproteobacteria bacterium]
MISNRMNKIIIFLSKTLPAICIAGASAISQAGSFGLIEQSASGQGAAYAGAAAVAEDASTIYFNPAGMTRLSGQQIVVAGHYIAPDAKFTNNGSTGVTGPDSKTDQTGFVPNFYYSTELDNGVFAGVGVNVPFGLATEYDAGWIGRYHALRSEITSININPAIAWKATDNVSVGFGVSIQYLDIELTNNINSNAICTGFCPGTPDGYLKLTADSTEMGWNAGILIDLDDKSRIGVAYRSAIKHKASGNADYNIDPALTAFINANIKPLLPPGTKFLEDTTLDATANLPDTFSVSYTRDIDSKWTVLADWTWVGWSSLDTITIIQAQGIPGREPTLDLAYADTSRYSVGVHYKPDNKWTYRGGIAYDETPIRSPEQTSPRIPGNDRTWLSLGLGYAPAASWSLDFGYSHLFLSDFNINKLNSTGETLTGSYEASVDIISAQANFNF